MPTHSRSKSLSEENNAIKLGLVRKLSRKFTRRLSRAANLHSFLLCDPVQASPIH